MILIQAIAFGLWAGREFWVWDNLQITLFGTDVPLLQNPLLLGAVLTRAGLVCGIFLFALDVAALFIQLRDRSVPRRSAFDSVGAAMSLNTVLLSALGFVLLVLQNETNWRWVSRLSMADRLWPFAYQLPTLNGLVALSTGLALIPARRLPLGRGCRGGIGLLIGALWVSLLCYMNILLPILVLVVRVCFGQ